MCVESILPPHLTSLVYAVMAGEERSGEQRRGRKGLLFSLRPLRINIIRRLILPLAPLQIAAQHPLLPGQFLSLSLPRVLSLERNEQRGKLEALLSIFPLFRLFSVVCVLCFSLSLLPLL